MSLDLFKNKGQKEATYLIENCNGILLGSRAFGVNNDYADWDVAIMATDLPEKYQNTSFLDPSMYFNLLPLGNSFLIREPHLDILVYENVDDFNVIREVVNELKDMPKYYLKQKYLRVILFETALQHYGFKASKPVSVLTENYPFDNDVPF